MSILNTPGFRYIFEIIVIVFSVTLSFYIQDVLNDRDKIELKNETLKGIINDLVKDFENFNDAQEVLGVRVKSSEKFLSGQTSNVLINRIITTYDFAGVDSNYKSLLSTGAIEYINNKSLIQELTLYYEKNYSVLVDLFGQYKHLYLDFIGFMTSNYPIEAMEKTSFIENKIEFKNWSEMSFKYSDKTLLKLNKDFEFQNHVYSLKRIILTYSRYFELANDRNKKLKKLIELELKKIDSL